MLQENISQRSFLIGILSSKSLSNDPLSEQVMKEYFSSLQQSKNPLTKNKNRETYVRITAAGNNDQPLVNACFLEDAAVTLELISYARIPKRITREMKDGPGRS